MDNKNQPNDNSSQNELDLGFNHSDSVTPRKPVQQSGSIFDKAKGLFGKKEQPDTQFHVRREPTFGAAASQPFSPSQAFQSENAEQSAPSSAFGAQEPVENVQVENVAEEKVIFENSPAEEIVEEFHNLWNSEYALPYDDFYEIYRERYNIIKHQREIAKSEEIPSLEKYRLKPNSMQERFIANLRKILEQGEERALLISATGTGKTFASAFAMRELGFKRVLFLVHRVTLAKQAKKSFEKVFGKKVTMGVVGAGFYEYEKEYVFATVETLNRDTHLFQYQPFMACVLGASFCGSGIGIAFSSNGSTGGTDIIAAIINKYRDITLGRVMMICDMIIITSSYFVLKDWEKVVYGFVTLYVCSFVLDQIVNSARQSVQFFIISKKYQEIGKEINALHRGVTVIDATGLYTGQEQKMMFVLAKKRQSTTIFRIINDIDPTAFVSQSAVIGVYGEGFDHFKLKKSK